MKRKKRTRRLKTSSGRITFHPQEGKEESKQKAKEGAS
jgi:hypothetical protein